MNKTQEYTALIELGKKISELEARVKKLENLKLVHNFNERRLGEGNSKVGEALNFYFFTQLVFMYLIDQRRSAFGH